MNRKDKANLRNAGFVDSDLMTDEHDQIMIWLHENINEIIEGKGYTVNFAQWERPISKGSGQYRTIVGYADLFVSTVEGHNFIFEVKSKIKNVGEAIRQIRQYQFFARDASYVIVCPSNKFESILESQRIEFLRCPIFDDDDDDDDLQNAFGWMK